MTGEMSFLVHPVELLLKHASTLVAGIRQVDAIFYDPVRKCLQARQQFFNAGQQKEKELPIDKYHSILEKLRNGKSRSAWFAPDELPYRTQSSSKKTVEMFEELDKLVLMVRIPNDADEKSDLMFFHYPPDLRLFGLVNAKSDISASEKDIISRSLINAINTQLKIRDHDRESWKLFSNMAGDNRRKLLDLTQQLNEVTRRYEERLVDSCQYVLDGLSEKFERKYVFSEDALVLIRKYKGEYHKIENALIQAVNLANMLKADEPAENTEIGSDLFSFNAGKPADELEEQIADSIFEKPYRYLDMLEQAAVSIKKQQMPVTSKNVAEAMKKPVKPPAITWTINKHMKLMQKLFTMYPDKWPLIRSDFKPILRISA